MNYIGKEAGNPTITSAQFSSVIQLFFKIHRNRTDIEAILGGYWVELGWILVGDHVKYMGIETIFSGSWVHLGRGPCNRHRNRSDIGGGILGGS